MQNISCHSNSVSTLQVEDPLAMTYVPAFHPSGFVLGFWRAMVIGHGGILASVFIDATPHQRSQPVEDVL